MITVIAGILIERKEWFLELLLDHVMLAGTAILLAGSIGLALGILINQYQKSAQLVLSLVNMLYTIPDIAMFGFLIPLTGIGKKQPSPL